MQKEKKIIAIIYLWLSKIWLVNVIIMAIYMISDIHNYIVYMSVDM